MPSTMAMANHVARIARRRGVAVDERDGASGRAWRKGDAARVRIAPVRSTVTYAVALHELGHCLGRGRSAPRLECEANAWAWALRNAMKDTVDETFTKTMTAALLGYLLWACKRSGWDVSLSVDGYPQVLDPVPSPGCPACPPNGHQFWDLLGIVDQDMFDTQMRRWHLAIPVAS